MTGKHSAVMLFVTGLSDSVTHKELRSIFRKLIKSNWRTRWSGQGLIRSCNIIRITDRNTGECEYHGLVELQPAKLALLAVRELNGTEIAGHPIEIRRYNHRSPLHDQLRYPMEGEPVGTPREEQRRSNLTIELVDSRHPILPPSLSRWLTFAGRGEYGLKEPGRHTT